MPLSVVYNGATYYYILSLQGDVVAILDSSGVSVAEYTYDAWGRLLSNVGVLVHNICSNPNGKEGGATHQSTRQTIGNDIVSRGYSVIYEYRVNTTGGYKNTRYLDIYATNGHDSFGVQIGLMTKGGLPVARERYAINDISGAGISVIFIRYK